MLLPHAETTVKDLTFVTWNSLSELTKDTEWINPLRFLELGSKGNSVVLIKISLLAVCMTSNSNQGKTALGFSLLYTFSLGENSSHGPSPCTPTLMTAAEFHEISNSSHEFPKWVTKGSSFYHCF